MKNSNLQVRISPEVEEEIERLAPKSRSAFVREATGFAIGGIPPFGHASRLVPHLDADLLQYETVWAAAGTPNAIFPVDPARLRDATGAVVIRVR